MPIRKFRSVAEMPHAPALARLDPENLRVAASWSEFLYRLHPWRFPPGVHKHRSIEDANRTREQWEAAPSA